MYDKIKEVTKFNPYHGKDGRFTTASGGGAAAAPKAKWTSRQGDKAIGGKEKDNDKKDDRYRYATNDKEWKDKREKELAADRKEKDSDKPGAIDGSGRAKQKDGDKFVHNGDKKKPESELDRKEPEKTIVRPKGENPGKYDGGSAYQRNKEWEARRKDGQTYDENLGWVKYNMKKNENIDHIDEVKGGGMMAILFYDDVKKGINSREEALRILRSFLDENEPQLVYFLHRIWNTQQKAITYKELREAIMKGYLTPEIIEEWQQDYSKFVVDHIKPMYAAAMAAAATQISRKYPAFSFNTAAEGVKIWTDTRAAEFVTNSTAEQVHAIRYAVARASQLQDVSVDGLARSIRAMVGLNKPQAQANLNYYKKMIESGVPEKKAVEQSIKYSARQSRYRGYMIARTELAFSYNKGEQFSVEQAVEEGYMGEMDKVWCTADDERTCSTCGKLEGKRIGLKGHFGFQTKLKQRDFDIDLTPPAHPQCRCTVLYVEAKPPNFTHL